MKPKSIRSHLKPYKILAKRRTTIAHAFASALAPTDEYCEEVVNEALTALGQKNLNELTCVYCHHPAQTWDHLTGLVKAGEFNGYGHLVGNLVPCCRDCNSAKGSKSFEQYVDDLHLDSNQKTELKNHLSAHQRLAKKVDAAAATTKETELLKQYREIQDKVLALLQEWDECAQKIRAARGS
jgi:hypothetical protein